jgi:nucleotide-binding universal stress UspA family protein
VIVVGVDGSEGSAEILRFALYEAGLRGTRLRAVRAWSSARRLPVTGPGVVPLIDPDAVRDAATTELAALIDAVAGDRAAGVDRVVVEAPAGEGILEHAKDAELIVVGTRAHGTLAEIVLGSVSRHVVRHAHCPVVVVPPRRD